MTDPRPGWYPDPAGSPDEAPTGFRWWDGAAWSDDVSDSPDAAVPSAPSAPPPAGSASRLRTVLVLGLGFTLFVTASLGVALVLWRDSTGSGSARGPAAVTPSPDPTAGAGSGSPTGQLNLRTRVATIGNASMTLPPDPYLPKGDPKALPGVFDLMFLADAAVHERSFHGQNWSATVAFGRLSDSVGGDDLSGRGEVAMERLSAAFYGGLRTTVSDMRWTDATVGGCPGKRFTANVHYTSPKLPSRYDAVTVLVVQLDDGSVIVAMSSVPDDADPELGTQAAAALDSLTIS